MEEFIAKIYGKVVIKGQEMKFVDTESEKIFGDNKEHILHFDLYDGFGYCADYEGEEYYLTYPTLDFVNKCPDVEQSIKEFCALKDEDEITVFDIVKSYCELRKV